jgi:hypothetical protein
MGCFRAMKNKARATMRKITPGWLVAVVVLAMTGVVARAAEPLAGEARATMEKATAYMRSIATEGGYLWRYSPDLKERAGENTATATQIWVQPPGTPSMGMTFLRAYEVTKDARYLDAAKAAADALAVGQLESGGWDYLIDFDPKLSAAWYRRSDVGKISAKGGGEAEELFDLRRRQYAERAAAAARGGGGEQGLRTSRATCASARRATMR